MGGFTVPNSNAGLFNGLNSAGLSNIIGSGAGNTLGNIFTGGLTGALSGIFGGGSPGFKPYTDANGNLVFAPPSKTNPVPVTNVPGANLVPNKSISSSC